MVSSISILLVMFFLAALPVAMMYKISLGLKKRRFPFSERLLRPAGYSVGKKLDDIIFDLTAYLISSIFIGVVASILLFSNAIAIIIVGITLLALELVLIYKSYNLAIKAFNYNLGYAGELAVGQSLNQLMLDGYHVYHDLEIENKFNIDHVVVGKNGVFAIETKAKTKPKNKAEPKKFKVSYDGKSLFFDDNPEYAEKKFLEQASRQAKYLNKEISEALAERILVCPVLVIPGWYVEYKVNQNNAVVKVFSHNILDSLKNIKTDCPLNEKQIAQIVYQLKKHCCNLDMNRGRWEE